MAGIIFLAIFFLLGGGLVFLVNRAVTAEDARYRIVPEPAEPTAQAPEYHPVHDKAA